MARPRLLMTAETPERKTLSTGHLMSETEILAAMSPRQRRLLADMSPSRRKSAIARLRKK